MTKKPIFRPKSTSDPISLHKNNPRVHMRIGALCLRARVYKRKSHSLRSFSSLRGIESNVPYKGFVPKPYEIAGSISSLAKLVRLFLTVNKRKVSLRRVHYIHPSLRHFVPQIRVAIAHYVRYGQK